MTNLAIAATVMVIIFIAVLRLLATAVRGVTKYDGEMRNQPMRGVKRDRDERRARRADRDA